MPSTAPSPLRVRWIGWWPAVSEPTSPFRQLLEVASKRPCVSVSASDEADLEWWSSTIGPIARGSQEARRVLTRRGVKVPEVSRYWREWQRKPPIPRVWWSGENFRPPHHFDKTFSFDLDSYGGTNSYLPYWWISPSLFLPNDVSPQVTAMLRPRQVDGRPRKFCCAFFGKMDPFRERLIHALQAIDGVDVFGRAVGKPVPDKARVAAGYAFTLCPENDLYPGYVTEKPLDAWRSRTVPLWWGSDPAQYINPTAVMNLAEYGDLASFVSAVAEMWQDETRWGSLVSQPILLKPPDFEGVISALREVLPDPAMPGAPS
jgi:hypothetical protein